VRYCARYLLQAVSPSLLMSLRSYIEWADVVHLFAVYSFPTLPTILQCRASAKPIVWSPLGALQRWQEVRRPTLKAIWDFVWYHAADLDRLVLNCTSEKEKLDTLTRLPHLQSVVIPHGVEAPNKVDPTDGNGKLRLLFLGRLHPIKGIELLLQACRYLPDNLLWQLTLAGSGEASYVNQLTQQMEYFGLRKHINLAGQVVGEAKKILFEHSDVLLVPSYSESFGLVVAEALAHGVPVIASRGTPWSTLKEKGCGLWVENTPKELANAIQKIASLPLRNMGTRGREWMLAEYSWHSVGQQTVDLYRKSLRSVSCRNR